VTRLKKFAIAGVLAVVTLSATASTASAHDNGDHAPHSTAPVGGLITLNGDVNILNDACIAPWHWDGPVQVLTDNAPYQACQDEGGVQTDAPAVDLSQPPRPLPILFG